MHICLRPSFLLFILWVIMKIVWFQRLFVRKKFPSGKLKGQCKNVTKEIRCPLYRRLGMSSLPFYHKFNASAFSFEFVLGRTHSKFCHLELLGFYAQRAEKE